MPRSINKQTGLTVVEIFIVIALISLFLSIVMAALTKARAEARDARRVIDVSEIQKGLNIYYATNQQFPIFTRAVILNGEDPFSKKLLESGVMQSFPTDPTHPLLSYYYLSNNDGSDYFLTYCLETSSLEGKSKGCDNTLGP